MSAEGVLARVAALGTGEGLNVVAFSGGVDSSVVAWAVRQVFPTTARACIGLSAALPMEQLELAREVAGVVGVPLVELPTHEGELPGYVANQGASCFFCKSTLYGTLQDFAQRTADRLGDGRALVLFNGTNRDDLRDPTRLGLKAAANFAVASPIDHLSKSEVREVAREVGLPNWAHAASPCLRSRLEFGVAATPERLARVERAERLVRGALTLRPHDNLRVRVLHGEIAVVEVDAPLLPAVEALLPALHGDLSPLGFSAVRSRAFASGALSGAAALISSPAPLR